MDKSEVMGAVLTWVLGMCYIHNEETKTFAVFRTFYDDVHQLVLEGARCALWVQDCQEKVWKYVNGRQIMLDASCSDFQRNLAIRADHIFREHFK
jgi:hypothetical protein